MECFRETGNPAEEIAQVEFRDDSRYEFTCARGHVTTTILQQQRFELLFEIGAHAIADGYYREAVSSFTSALERFYEFAIRVLLQSQIGGDELFQQCWKYVSRQSERQLGAFAFVWALSIGNKPELVSNKQVEFRNDVIHRGRIPTREEAIVYGNAMLESLRPQMSEIKRRFHDAVIKVTLYHLQSSRQDSDRERRVSTLSMGTFVNLATGEAGTPLSLEEYVASLLARRRGKQAPT